MEWGWELEFELEMESEPCGGREAMREGREWTPGR